MLDDADQERFDRLRYVELKHGRVSQLAVLGHIVTSAGVRLPGDIDYSGTSFDSIPTGIAALSKVPSAGLLQIFLFVGFLELAVMKDVTGEAEFPVTSVMVPWTSAGTPSMRRPRLPSVPLSSTTAVPLRWESLL